MSGCYWYHPDKPGYCCWGIDPAGLDPAERWAGPESYSHGPCPCGGDPRSRDCLCSDKKPWQRTEPWSRIEEEHTARFSIWDYEHEKNVLEKYEGDAPEPSLPGRIRKIGNWVFADNRSITGIYLPKGLTEIGENAFNGCRNLKSAAIPGSVTKIGEYAFHGCYTLERVEFLPGEPMELGNTAFCDCRSLREFRIPSRVREIPESLCFSCISLENVVIASGAVSIDRCAFANCWSLKTVFIPESVVQIHDDTFSFHGFERPAGLTICGVPGSVAEEYARRKGVAFRVSENEEGVL